MTDHSAPTRGEAVFITRADIALARKLVAQFQDDDFDCERISHEVAAHRLAAIEQCAKVCDDNRTDDDSMWDRASAECASLIRNLGRGV